MILFSLIGPIDIMQQNSNIPITRTKNATDNSGVIRKGSFDVIFFIIKAKMMLLKNAAGIERIIPKFSILTYSFNVVLYVFWKN